MATKEKDVLGHIIELYKDMPYLWNKNDKNYMNKSIRCEDFEVLLSIYKNVDKNATIKTLKRKIDNLKTNFLYFDGPNGHSHGEANFLIFGQH